MKRKKRRRVTSLSLSLTLGARIKGLLSMRDGFLGAVIVPFTERISVARLSYVLEAFRNLPNIYFRSSCTKWKIYSIYEVHIEYSVTLPSEYRCQLYWTARVARSRLSLTGKARRATIFLESSAFDAAVLLLFLFRIHTYTHTHTLSIYSFCFVFRTLPARVCMCVENKARWWIPFRKRRGEERKRDQKKKRERRTELA